MRRRIETANERFGDCCLMVLAFFYPVFSEGLW